MPLKLTVEVPDEMVADLDALADIYGETREAFATQSVKFCIRKGAEVEFHDDDDLPTPEEVRARVAGGESRPFEEVVRELDHRDAARSREGAVEAAE